MFPVDVNASGREAPRGVGQIANLPNRDGNELVPHLPCFSFEAPGLFEPGLSEAILPYKVSRALERLNELLRPLGGAGASDVANVTKMPLELEEVSWRGFIKEVETELRSLYWNQNADQSKPPPDMCTPLADVAAHFLDVAKILRLWGYERFHVNFTRNAFAQEFHIHSCFFYLLYAGRQLGTEIIPGTVDRNGCKVFTGITKVEKNTWEAIPPSPLPETIKSDPSRGLFLPPRFAHRAIASIDRDWLSEANLAIALLAAKPNL